MQIWEEYHTLPSKVTQPEQLKWWVLLVTCWIMRLCLANGFGSSCIKNLSFTFLTTCKSSDIIIIIIMIPVLVVLIKFKSINSWNNFISFCIIFFQPIDIWYIICLCSRMKVVYSHLFKKAQVSVCVSVWVWTLFDYSFVCSFSLSPSCPFWMHRSLVVYAYATHWGTFQMKASREWY